MVIDRYAQRRTKIRVVLVAQEDWVRADPKYDEQFVQFIKTDVLGTWQEKLRFNLDCEVVVLPFDKEGHVTGWLLKRLLVFFKEQNEGFVFVDLTAAPTEWLFAALTASQFFENVNVYSVKSSAPLRPSDYSETEINDRGIPRLELNSMRQASLNAWITPADTKGKSNDQFFLFKTIYDLAKSKAGDSSAEALTRIWIDIGRDDEIKAYKSSLPHERSIRFDNNFSALKKSASIYLDAVAPYRLFDVREHRRSGKSVRMTERGAMLGTELFVDAESSKGETGSLHEGGRQR